MAKKDKKNQNAAAGVPPVGVVPPMGGVNSTGMYGPGGIPSTGMYGMPGTGIPSTGIPSTGIPSTGMYGPGGIPMGAPPPTAPVPPPAPADKKGKKEKKNKKKGKNDAQAQIDTSKLTPEQLAQLQLEEAIKESTDPSSRLRKLKSPLSVGGCLIMLAVFIVATILIVFFVCWLLVDKFDPLLIAKDMLDQFGISAFFKMIGDFFTGLFNGSGGGESSEIIKAVFKLFM